MSLSTPQPRLCACHDEPMYWHRRGHAGDWECAVKSREGSRRWRQHHPEKARESSLRWKENNPELRRESIRRWRENNPEKAREHQRRNSAWIQSIKVESGCTDCGVRPDDPGELHFHHVDPTTKLFDVAHGGSRSRESVAAEIAKCVVLCSRCHRKAHRLLNA